MQNIRVSLKLNGDIVKDVGSVAKRLNMTSVEYIKNGIVHFNSINKQRLSLNHVRSNSIIGQEASSTILRELKTQQNNHIIL